MRTIMETLMAAALLEVNAMFSDTAPKEVFIGTQQIVSTIVQYNSTGHVSNELTELYNLFFAENISPEQLASKLERQ